MQLTKEQIEELEGRVKYHDDCDLAWVDNVFTNEMRELLRGYRAYLAEVERLKVEIDAAYVEYAKRKENDGACSVVVEEITRLKARLSALQKGQD